MRSEITLALATLALGLGCTRHLVSDAGPDTTVADVREDPDTGLDAPDPDDGGPDAADVSVVDATPLPDDGGVTPLDGCREGVSPIPLASSWLAYFDADVGLSAEGTTRGAASEIAVSVWRSRVGTATLRVPSGATGPTLELNGWGRRLDCATCPAAVRFRTSASRNDALRDGAGTLDVVGAGDTLTIAVELEHPTGGSGTIGWVATDGSPSWRLSTSHDDVALDRPGGTSTSSVDAPRFLALVRSADPDGATVRVFTAGHGAIVERTALDDDAVLALTGGRFTIGAIAAAAGVGDLRVRRIAVSSTALGATDLAAVWSAWSARDASLATAAALAYQNVVAEDGPIALWRLGAELYPQATPEGATLIGAAPIASTLACSLALSERYDAATDTLTGGFLEIPDAPIYTIPTSGRGLSIELWLYLENVDPTGEPGPSGRKDYIHWVGKGERSNYEWAFRLYRSDSASRPSRLSFYAWDLSGGEGPGDYTMLPTATIRARWMHVVGVSDDPGAPDARLSIYVDGVPGAGGPASRFASEAYGASPGDGSAPVRLGTRSENGFLTGRLADVAIYPRALTAAEIRLHHDAGSGWRDLE